MLTAALVGDRRDLAVGGRDRDHERDARLGLRAHPRDRAAEGARRDRPPGRCRLSRRGRDALDRRGRLGLAAAFAGHADPAASLPELSDRSRRRGRWPRRCSSRSRSASFSARCRPGARRASTRSRLWRGDERRRDARGGPAGVGSGRGAPVPLGPDGARHRDRHRVRHPADVARRGHAAVHRRGVHAVRHAHHVGHQGQGHDERACRARRPPSGSSRSRTRRR